MKVLMTGMSPPQCGRPTMTKYEHISDLWVKALRAAEVDVYHERIDEEHDLSQYDVAFVGLIPPNSIAARYVWTAMDVIARAEENSCGLIYYVDDWRYFSIASGLKTFNKQLDKYLTHDMFKHLWKRDWAQTEGRARIAEAVSNLHHERWPAALVPAFNWGDHSLLPELPTNDLVVADPSSFAREYEIPFVPDAERAKRWVMGTFSDQRAWIEKQELSWPVHYVGTRRSKAEAGHVKEPDLVATYGTNWGVLGAPYGRHSGSGWWRNRFVYGARANALVLAEPKETIGLDGFHVPGASLERMGDDERSQVADFQQSLMESSYTPQAVLSEQLLNACHRAVKRVGVKAKAA